VPSTNPTPGYQGLGGVEAASAGEAWSVGEGQDGKTLALHWNGSAWQEYLPPNPPTNNEVYLKSVAETAPSDVWAVGSYYDNNHIGQPLAEHWDGAHWTIVPTLTALPGDSYVFLSAIKMISHTNGWAVGSEGTSTSVKSVIEHWNGSKWTRMASPNAATGSNNLTSLAVLSSSNIWASGEGEAYNSVLLHYNGATWSIVHTNPARIKALASVSSSEIFDVGYQPSNSIEQSYAEKYNGSSWMHQITPNAGSDQVELEGAAAVSANEVFAVGAHGNGTTTISPFAIMWNGTSWIASHPLAIGWSAFYGAAAIPGTKDAFAVGYSKDFGNGAYQTLVERVHCL
jgi:hypothetical protein